MIRMLFPRRIFPRTISAASIMSFISPGSCRSFLSPLRNFSIASSPITSLLRIILAKTGEIWNFSEILSKSAFLAATIHLAIYMYIQSPNIAAPCRPAHCKISVLGSPFASLNAFIIPNIFVLANILCQYFLCRLLWKYFPQYQPQRSRNAYGRIGAAENASH